MDNYGIATPLIAVVGETAAGKSAAALALAEEFSGEIINADSWQIYRGMDIGTAKPSLDERQRVPHHLFDIVDPNQDFTAAVYKRMAKTVINDIQQRGNLPILVGGTGLYIDGVLFDYSFTPPGNPGERERWQRLDIPELLAEIERRGYSLTGVDTRNKRRLIRLLENRGQMPTQSQMPETTLAIGVQTTSRAQLRRNIEERVEKMFRDGLKHEVQELVQTYGWEVEAMKGVGYREFYDYFEGEQSLAATKRRIIKNTLDLAKKQRTWFKRNRHIVWVESIEAAQSLTADFMANLPRPSSERS